MGATRWQTIHHVLTARSISGILTGVILEISRTTGETAPIMFTGAAFFLPFLPPSVFDQTMAMSCTYSLFQRRYLMFRASTHGVALVLIGMVLVLNSVSIAFRMYLRGKKNGERRANDTAGRRTMLSVKDVSIRYGNEVALQGVTSTFSKMRFLPSSGPPIVARPRSYALSTGWTI